MIVPMKKLFLIVQKKDIESSLQKLADLGTVHIENCQAPVGHNVDQANEQVEMFDQVISALESCKFEGKQVDCTDWQSKANEVLDLQALVNQYTESMSKREEHISKWADWGNFEPKDIEDLAEQGIHVQLYEIPTSDKNAELPRDHVFHELPATKTMRRFVRVSESAEPLLFDRVKPGSSSLSSLKAMQKKEQSNLDKAKNLLRENAAYFEQFNRLREDAQFEVSFSEAACGMTDRDDVCFLKGFIPDEGVMDIKEFARMNNMGILLEDPTDDDDVPTLMKNPKWVNLSKPALGLIEVLPGYKEVDVSAVFLIFFTLFFGILIGDAAYGAIFMILTFVMQKKFGSKIKDHTAFKLGYLLTGFTIIWGVLTGTYFGQQWLPASVHPVVPWLNDANNVQWLCFTIALVHLSLARIWSAMIRFPSITFISEVGWLMIIWGMYFLANMFVLGKTLPSFTAPLILGGAGVALLFMFPTAGKFKKGVGQEVIPHALAVIGAGTDIISYIRLFAVGMATVAVADAANAMPGQLGLIGGGILMVFLHILNLILALMAILVHAIRLNVLEFSGHMGLEWAGAKYNPFKKKLKEATI